MNPHKDLLHRILQTSDYHDCTDLDEYHEIIRISIEEANLMPYIFYGTSKCFRQIVL